MPLHVAIHKTFWKLHLERPTAQQTPQHRSPEVPVVVSSRRPNHARARKPSQECFFGSGRRSSKQHTAFPAAQAPGAAELHRRRCGTARGRLRDGTGQAAGCRSPFASLAAPPARAASSRTMGSPGADAEGEEQLGEDSERSSAGAKRQDSRRCFPERVSPRGQARTRNRLAERAAGYRHAAGGVGFFLSGSRKRLLPVPVPLPVPPLTLGSGERGGGPAPPGPRCARPAAEPAPSPPRSCGAPAAASAPPQPGGDGVRGSDPPPPSAPFPFPSP